MRASPQIHLLTEIHRLDHAGPEAQRAAFRKAMADLAAMVVEQRPVPLEGLDPGALLQGMRACLRQGLLDDLSFISGPAAMVGLYQIAAYLPRGDTRAELSRRVAAALLQSDGPTFAALSAALAIGSPDPFASTDLRCRVELVVELSSSERRAADALSLSLISRPSLQRAWLSAPATSSLPARRRCARILERAAREAVRRATQGDRGVLVVFQGDTVRAAWRRLLGDRESLVWRHVAAARGLLAPWLPELDEEVQQALHPSLTPTEWRRAAVSEVAAIAFRREAGLARCTRVLDGPLPKRDQGLPGAMVFGIARAAEAEPRVAETLLARLVECGGDYAIETLVDLLREEDAEAASRACQAARVRLDRVLSAHAKDLSASRRATLSLCRRQLDLAGANEGSLSPAGSDMPLPNALSHAVEVFGRLGPAAAAERATRVLDRAEAAMARLEHAGCTAALLPLLWELDVTLLQSSALGNLLRLGPFVEGALQRFEQVRARLHQFLLDGEREHALQETDLSLRMRRLVCLLHAVDAEAVTAAPTQRRRQLETVRALLPRVPREYGSALGRVLCATLARAFDALLDSEAFEVSDVLLIAGLFVRTDHGLRVLSEASMNPQLERVLERYAELTAAAAELGSLEVSHEGALHAVEALLEVIPVASSPRAEALRQAMLALDAALRRLSKAPCLEALAMEPHEGALGSLGGAVHALSQLSAGAAKRFSAPFAEHRFSCGQRVLELQAAVEGALMAKEAVPWDTLVPPLFEALQAELPGPLAALIQRVVELLVALPVTATEGVVRSPLPPAPPRRLPAWLPPSRVLGGFYVLDTLGEGAVGSVFVATRVEDRGRKHAPRFALKVPAYDSQAARALSEEEFLALFRKEAGALLALPGDHPNIAAFVTFDAGAKPKPLLVMELVPGPSLSRLLARGRLRLAAAVAWLAGVARGLAAVHALGIAHLDVKPANIIVHTDPEVERDHGRAVLVDFGLSGRMLRAGCATAPYGAPEIWGLLPEPDYDDPRPADVYAFGCTAFEVLTGQELFCGPDDMAIISAHITHDGMPSRLQQLAGIPALRPLSELLCAALRKNPRDRIDITAVEARLAALSPMLETMEWPLLPRNASAAA